jgi:hypothetical protein
MPKQLRYDFQSILSKSGTRYPSPLYFEGRPSQERPVLHYSCPLPNPSGRAENQWYDVRFDDQSLARLVERYLQEEVKADNGETAAD